METRMSDLDEWRKRIDEVDRQLVKLLNERSQCAVEIGHLKKKLKLPAWQPQRETEGSTDYADAAEQRAKKKTPKPQTHL